ncbi:MAG: hypothetical protein NC307_00025 [Roseburia sp.]|nr:hypothetical protein [Roseburia sp.]
MQMEMRAMTDKAVLHDKVDFYVVREAKRNPKVNPERKLSILWRPEELLQRQMCQELFERDCTLIEDTIREYRKKAEFAKF